LAGQIRRHERTGCEAAEEMEAENSRLKKLLAESLLDTEALKVALGRKR